jgi:hypothetical protein
LFRLTWKFDYDQHTKLKLNNYCIPCTGNYYTWIHIHVSTLGLMTQVILAGEGATKRCWNIFLSSNCVFKYR